MVIQTNETSEVNSLAEESKNSDFTGKINPNIVDDGFSEYSNFYYSNDLLNFEKNPILQSTNSITTDAGALDIGFYRSQDVLDYIFTHGGTGSGTSQDPYLIQNVIANNINIIYKISMSI